LNFRVAFEHQRLKSAGQRFRVGGEPGIGFFDDSDRFLAEHQVNSRTGKFVRPFKMS
jgi:hypothetical protein